MKINNNNSAQTNASKPRSSIDLPKRKISASNEFIFFNISKIVFGNFNEI